MIKQQEHEPGEIELSDFSGKPHNFFADIIYKIKWPDAEDFSQERDSKSCEVMLDIGPPSITVKHGYREVVRLRNQGLRELREARAAESGEHG